MGGYVIANPQIIQYLQFQSRQHIFSVTATPASACILKSTDLIDDEPFWQDNLWENINYLKSGLLGMSFDLGNTQSAIIPVMTGNPNLNAEACHLLMEAGVYANQIGYPAVPKKRARIRMSIMATHTLEQMDKVLNGWEWVDKKLHISNNQKTNYGNKKENGQEIGLGTNEAEDRGSGFVDHAREGAHAPGGNEDNAAAGPE